MDAHDEPSTAAAPPEIDPTNDRIRGPVGGPLVTVYADLTCPDCAVALDRLQRIGARIELKHFALKARGPRPLVVACAAEAAGWQGAFWPFVDSVMADRGRLDDPHLWARATKLGLDLDQFEADRRSDRATELVKADGRTAIREGAGEVPALFATLDDAAALRASGYDGSVRIRS